MQDHSKPTAAPGGDSASAEFAEPIVPIDFTPPDATPRRAGLRLRWPHFLVAGFLLVAGVCGWFILTARSVLVQVEPITASVEFLEGFQLPLGGRMLMLPGSYEVLIRNAGYHDERFTLAVGDAPAVVVKGPKAFTRQPQEDFCVGHDAALAAVPYAGEPVKFKGRLGVLRVTAD